MKINECVGYSQHLNCKGDAGGRITPSRVSVPPSKFSVYTSRFRRPPIESWELIDQRKNSQIGLKDPTNFLPKMVANCDEDPFFCGLHWISGEKWLQFPAKTFFLFLIFIQFRRRKCIIFTKLFVKLVKAAKASPHAKFYDLSTGYSQGVTNAKCSGAKGQQ